MSLLKETWDLDFKLIESEGRKRLRGVFCLAEVRNANNRIYPRAIIESEVKRLMPAIKERRILGELGHPEYTHINLERASHVVVQLTLNENKVFGEIEILSTPMGKILEALVNDGIKLGISSRGTGTLEERDGVYYVKELELITWDVVPNPSTPSAWLNEQSVKDFQRRYWEIVNNAFK